MRSSKQSRVTRFVRNLGMPTHGEVRRLEQSYINIRTSAFMGIGFVLTTLVFIVFLVGYTLGFFSSSFFRITPPPPAQPPPPKGIDRPTPSVDLDTHEAFRDKVDLLQKELAGLNTRQTELEAKLRSKTAEAVELAGRAQWLRTELLVKELEIDALSDQATPSTLLGRQFQSGITRYIPADDSARQLQGFALHDGAVIKPATAGPEMPAELIIQLEPRNAYPGEPYQLSVRIHNYGNRSMVLSGLDIVWSFAGRNTGGSIPFLTRRVAPKSTIVLHEVDGVWAEELTAALIVATVTLKEGGRLTNTLSWREG